MPKYEVVTKDGSIVTNIGTFEAANPDAVIEQIKAQPSSQFDDWTYDEQLSFIKEVQ